MATQAPRAQPRCPLTPICLCETVIGREELLSLLQPLAHRMARPDCRTDETRIINVVAWVQKIIMSTTASCTYPYRGMVVF